MILRLISRLFSRGKTTRRDSVDLYVDGRFKISLEQLMTDEVVRYIVKFHGSYRVNYKLSVERFSRAQAKAERLLEFIDQSGHLSALGVPTNITELPYVGSLSETIGLPMSLMPTDNVKYTSEIFISDKNVPIIDVYICEKSGAYYFLLSCNIDVEGKNIYVISLEDVRLFAERLVRF